jgi:twinkle protein
MSQKTKCPECGSEDNLVHFDNGTSFCFTPACKYNDGRGSRVTLNPIPMAPRGITEATCAKYGVGIGPDGNLWAPYYKDGHVAAYKVRKPGKEFFWEGASKQATLFGLQACSGNRRIIIVEGELDALAAFDMSGYPAVSIRNASTATADVKANLEFLETYEYVYVATDMDTAGRAAGQAIMELLRPGKGYLVTLPEGFKDACEMAGKGLGYEFKQCLYAAQPVNIAGVISDEDIRSKALELFSNETKRRGVSTLFPSLDYLLGGFRPGEVTLVAGGTGVGKTAIVRQLAVNLAAQKLPVFFIPLEMNPEVVALQMVEMMLHGNVFTSPEFSVQKIDETVFSLTQYVKFFDHFGTIDPIKLINTIEYVCRVHDIKYVVLDHISAVVNGGEDERRGVDQCIAGLKSVALRLGLHILVVSHISRSKDDPDDNHPTLSKIRHSAGLAQYSDQVLGVQRARSDNKTEIKTLKVSRLWGQYGSAHLEWVDYHFQEATKKGGKNDTYRNCAADDFLDSIIVGSGSTHLGSEQPELSTEEEGEEIDGPDRGDDEPLLLGLGSEPRPDSDTDIRGLLDSVVYAVSGLDGVINAIGSIDFGSVDSVKVLPVEDCDDYSLIFGSHIADSVDYSRSEAVQLDEEDSIQQEEQERPTGRLRQYSGEDRLSGEREHPPQQGEGTIHQTSELHAGLHVSVTTQGADDRGEGSLDRERPLQVQGSEGQLHDDSRTLGDGRSRTGFRLSEGGWAFEPQEP